MNNLLERARAAFEYVPKVEPVLIGMEAILVGIIGLSAGQFTAGNGWKVLCLLSILLYAFLAIHRYLTSKIYPTDFIEAIRSSMQHNTVSEQSARKTVINEAIGESLRGLNSQTCYLSEEQVFGYQRIEDVADKLCDQEVVDGLRVLLQPLIKNTHHLLGIADMRSTSGVFIKDIIATDAGTEQKGPIAKTFLISDQLRLPFQIEPNIMGNPATGGLQKVKSANESCYTGNVFETETFEEGGRLFTIVVSSVPVVCDVNESSGSLFIIVEGSHENLPSDIKETLSVFGRIIANWVDKYNQCAYGRYAREPLVKLTDDNNQDYVLFTDQTYTRIWPVPAEAELAPSPEIQEEEINISRKREQGNKDY